jgi:hypothetical protein
MVSIEEIQAAYYMVAATGVLIAAVFYILNLRVQQENMKGTAKNRRATLTNNILQTFLSDEGMAKFLELLSMEWTDFDDFEEIRLESEPEKLRVENVSLEHV